MEKPKIFISHISKETELAQVLKKHLAKDFLNFLDIFVSSDGKTIPAGGLWLNELNIALKEAKVEVILCSKESVGRPWVNFEAGAGWIRGIRVIPACHSGMGVNDLPVPLSMLQAIEINQPKSIQYLYEAIAIQLNMEAPKPDFENIAREIKEIERKYLRAEQALERIEDPHILCAASDFFTKEKKFELDVEVIERVFPNKCTIVRDLTAKGLRKLLTTHRFDIIHLVLEVNAETGDILFEPNIDSNKNTIDKMSAEGFAKLIVESKTSLIVLATCHALSLAVEIANLTNMIATHVEIGGKEVKEWGDCFYELIAQGQPLYKAFDLTKDLTKVPLRLIRQRNVVFITDTQII